MRGNGHTWTHSAKSSNLTCYLSLVNISMQKITEIDTLILVISMIKDFHNLIGWEHFCLKLVNQKFHRYELCTKKQRAAMYFTLGYFQQKVITFHKRYKNLFSFLSILTLTRIFLDQLLSLFLVFRFLLPCRISGKDHWTDSEKSWLLTYRLRDKHEFHRTSAGDPKIMTY